MSTAIISFGRSDTGLTIGDLTWDFCKSTTGTDISTADATLVELGVGVYELSNPHITTRSTFSIYITADPTKSVIGEFLFYDIVSFSTNSIINFDRGDTGITISDLTWDFCKRITGVDVSTTGSSLTELGVGVYELVNPNVTGRTTFSIYLTSDDSKSVVGEFSSYDTETLSDSRINIAGYSTYLQLVNKILKRITQKEITSGINLATGQAKIISELINEAQNELWMETTNWYTLYTTRVITTSNGVGTYALASNYGRTIDLCDTTTNTILVEDVMRSFDTNNPDSTVTGTPTHFSIQGGYYRFHPVPSGTLSIRERYWKIPGALSDDAATSDLPLFCENFIINWTLMSILEYLNKFDHADRVREKVYGNSSKNYEGMLQKAKTANKKMLDQMIRFEAVDSRGGLQPPRFPSHY